MTTTGAAICQSCGMPMPNAELYGTKQDGEATTEYCKYCYERGAYVQPDFKLEDMVELCTRILVEEGREEQATRTMLRGYLPHLRRWSAGAENAADSSVGNGNMAETESSGTSISAAKPDRIEQLEGTLQLAGIAVRTNNAREMTAEAAIPGMWDRFYAESPAVQNTAGTITGQPSAVYGLYTGYEDGITGEYTVMAALPFNAGLDANILPEGWTTATVAPARYAVFVSQRGPLVPVVIETWQRIWQWAVSPGTEARTFVGDFERYDERSLDPDNAIVEIYVGIR